VIHAGEVFAKAAGGGGVVAGVFAELGAEVDFFTALGEDQNGQAAKEQLERKGIRMHVAWRSEQPTRRAFTLLGDDGERTIVTIGERLDPLGSDELDWGQLKHADGVYVTAGDAAAFHQARQARVVVASPRARHALTHRDEEVDALVYSARDRDEVQWAEGVCARLKVTTEGSAGGSWSGESEGRWTAEPPPGPIKDSYGCGDSFAAGFTFALAQGATPAQAAAMGANEGARCLSKAGAP
jgi:ribokinase